MDTSIAGPLAAFNQLYKEMDKIYHRYARAHGLSDTHLWLLYSLRESQCHTQREISAIWHASPQTINSALKQLERQGFIALSAMAGNRKNKAGGAHAKGKAGHGADHRPADVRGTAGAAGPDAAAAAGADRLHRAVCGAVAAGGRQAGRAAGPMRAVAQAPFAARPCPARGAQRYEERMTPMNSSTLFSKRRRESCSFSPPFPAPSACWLRRCTRRWTAYSSASLSGNWPLPRSISRCRL